MKRIIPVLLLFLIQLAAIAQTATLKGKVTDRQTGEALPFCNVFINNTTLATTTNMDGEYTLAELPGGAYEVGFSFVGFEAVQKSISPKPGATLTLDVQLVSLEQELSDVEIKASRDRSWERELRKFKNLFLGNDEMAAKTELINPWVIDFPEDNSSNNFSAVAFQPIEIENHAMGYRLFFDLNKFQYTTQYHIISGASRFEEMVAPDEKTKTTWEKNRLDNYLKSPMNMFRSMLKNKHNQEGFYLYGDKAGGSESRNLRSDVFSNELGKSVVEYNPENLVQQGKNPGEYKILIKGRVEIHYEKGYSTVNTYKDAPYPISWLEVNGNYVTVDENGMILNQKDVTFSGDMDKRKVASLLPLDYIPNLGNRSETQLVQDANSLQEKVYLHTDRKVYYMGDQLFFKAYISYTDPQFKRELSKILYVEVISADRDVIVHKQFKIENGTAVGDFYLSDTLSANEYYLRAYTTWNRNYGPKTYFVEALPILTPFDRIVSNTISKEKSNFDFNQHKESYGKREKVKVNITVKDAGGNPVSANLSASVRDLGYAPEIEGYMQMDEQLEISAVPSHITTEKFTYPIETTLKVPGRFLNEKGKPSAASFTVYLNNFEGSVEMESDKEGLFELEDMDFYGPVDFAFIATDKKGRAFGTFELSPKLNPPFFVPVGLQFPEIKEVNEPIFIGYVAEEPEMGLDTVLVESTKPINTPTKIYGRADHIVKGENLNRNGTITDLLMSLKSQIPGMTVTTTLEIRIRGGATSSMLSMEPLVMIDGAVMPAGMGVKAANNLASINPNDIDRIEVVSRMNSMMGDLGRNGIIAVYLKKGPQQENFIASNTPGLQQMTMEGFSAPSNFIPFAYEEEDEVPEVDQRVTLYWNPYMVSDNSGNIEIEFYTNDSKAPKWVEIKGLDSEVRPVVGSYKIEIQD